MRPAKLYYNEGQIDDANINRSPTSYLANHKEDLKRLAQDKFYDKTLIMYILIFRKSSIYLIPIYRYKHDTDHTMYQLNIFHGLTDKPLGVINWFAVHPTSMNNTNHLISGDNKGLASQFLERYVNKNNRNVSFIYNLPNNPLIYVYRYYKQFFLIIRELLWQPLLLLILEMPHLI